MKRFNKGKLKLFLLMIKPFKDMYTNLVSKVSYVWFFLPACSLRTLRTRLDRDLGFGW